MMPSVLHLPDGQNFTVQPWFQGWFFKSNELNNGRQAPFPAGWSVVLDTEKDDDITNSFDGVTLADGDGSTESKPTAHGKTRPWSRPTLQNDSIFISGVSNPASSEFNTPMSQSRQTALMLYISLYWYFQQPEPSPSVKTLQSRDTPNEGKPKGEWRIRIKREGIFSTRNMIPKLERMGLISTMESAVGLSTKETSAGWDQMYVTRQSFWQIPSGLFLFTLQLKRASSHPGSPVSSRPGSPTRSVLGADLNSLPVGPYSSPSHLPTYYPPPPLQYTITNGVRHPVRSKPPRMGEIFYTRFVPSVGKYLSFRVASASNSPVPYLGPMGPGEKEHMHLTTLSDTSLLQMWLSKPRVSAFWGNYHSNFLTNALELKHSFPVIGLWDGVPFGYFEIYWVKEDRLGQYMSAENWDRGMHVIVGEEWARGRVSYWLSSLVHWCWQADNRTMDVYLEPRIDNKRFIEHLQNEGFAKEREISFPHKQAALCRVAREVWQGPKI